MVMMVILVVMVVGGRDGRQTDGHRAASALEIVRERCPCKPQRRWRAAGAHAPHSGGLACTR
eukprot:NODE_11244_length_1299_cov_5.250000.p4 GENE.NODE_11244_length_1299_cov_5.250000~~NODE_11244_length_1299_cov_5.250000.p4  ORF type:complete len:62 (-),score=7.91 NODE_11244_length_1299_cov_5.250000:286-471(-)